MERAKIFNDLNSVIQMALIDALEETAKVQSAHPNVGKKGYKRATFVQEPHDGFYTYHGSIDTSLVAEALEIAVVTKLGLEKRLLSKKLGISL